MRPFLEALRLVERFNEKAASDDSSGIGGALGVTRLDHAILSKADENDALLSIEAAEAHIRDRKQNVAFSGDAFYLYAAFSVLELGRMHSAACKKHPLSFGAFLLT